MYVVLYSIVSGMNLRGCTRVKPACNTISKVVIEMKKYAQELSGKTGMTIALVRTSAETTVQRFATKDLRNYMPRYMAKEVIQGDVEYALQHLDETIYRSITRMVHTSRLLHLSV